MKKIKLTKEEKKACRDVIATWKKKEKRLLRGDTIKEDRYGELVWISDKRKITESECPFCVTCGRTGPNCDCSGCLYLKAYGLVCYAESCHLRKFELKPNLRTCRACIRAVQRILDNAK